MRENIYNFFEHPKGFLAIFVQIIIFLLIILSAVMVAIEFLYPPLFHQYENLYHSTNTFILSFFTIEYLLRVATAPQKLKYIRKPLNVIDFFAIAPNYIELLLPIFVDTTELRVVRVIRLLRFARAFRLLRLFRFAKVFQKVLKYQGTILERITPTIVFFGVLKGLIWFLEAERLWIPDTNLGQLFAIIGFAIGIILSQKIGVSYDKFLQVGAATFRLYASLKTLTFILDKSKPNLGTSTIRKWTKAFIRIFKDLKANNFEMDSEHEKLYKAVSRVEPTPAHVTQFYLNVYQDANFCLSKKIRPTPRVYDTLLQRSALFYFLLIAIFVPGLTGMISVLVATYMLYGMYYLTQELDNITVGEFNLINVNTEELEHLIKN